MPASSAIFFWLRFSSFLRSRYRRCAAWHSARSEEHTSELQSRENLVCRLLLEKKKTGDLQRLAAKPGFLVENDVAAYGLEMNDNKNEHRGVDGTTRNGHFNAGAYNKTNEKHLQ